MAEFVQLNDDNVVIQCIIVADKDAPDEATGIAFCKSLFGSDTTWLETKEDLSFRGQDAGKGYTYDSSNNQFVPPRPLDKDGQSCASWTYNFTEYDWDPPIALPSDSLTAFMKGGGNPVGDKLADKAHPAGEATTAEWRKIVGGPFKTYDWDESLYQSDNTKGWVETGTVNNTPDDWEEPS
tara:strand:+ start:9258 stop:9800 length:543 start_codon:yes stop_codon:yes gene_type:complete